MKKKIKIKYKNIFIFLLLLVCLIVFIKSFFNIIIWLKDSKEIKKQTEEVQKLGDVKETNDSESVELIEQPEISAENPYWDYIKMNLIDVDFAKLKSKNSDTVGWIQVGGTNINYPFVQTNDNNYYLTHSFNKESNQAGWAFLDYRNNKSEYDKNTIIYGHALTNGAIFGTLNNILKYSWQYNVDNHIVKISTESENTLWQVFSVYKIPNTVDYLKVIFSSDEEFLNFINMLKERSVYNFDATVNENDKILTLSTCYKTSDTRVVLHAKLIKRELKYN